MKKLTAIEEEDWIDVAWGEIVSCESIPLSGDWPWNKGTCVPNRNPWEASCDFNIKYIDGQSAKITARGWEVLMGLGFRGEILDGKDFQPVLERQYEEPRFFNIGLMAVVAKALSEGTAIPTGGVSILDEVSARKVLEEFEIPIYPVVYDESNDADTYKKWKKKWLDSGVCVDDSNNYGLCISKVLLEEERSRRVRR